MLSYRIKTYRKAILWGLALLVSFLLLFVQCSASAEDVKAEPIKWIQTEQKVCAVTVTLTGIESDEALRLFMSVCRGAGIVPCIFATVDWIEEHSKELSVLEGAELGLLFSESPEKWTQKRTMTAIAEANDAFMVHTGTFPKYVRIAEGGCSQMVADLLSSYGQLLVGNGSVLSDPLQQGQIVDCALLDSTTGYALAQFYGNALSCGFTIVPLSDLLQS